MNTEYHQFTRGLTHQSAAASDIKIRESNKKIGQQRIKEGDPSSSTSTSRIKQVAGDLGKIHSETSYEEKETALALYDEKMVSLPQKKETTESSHNSGFFHRLSKLKDFAGNYFARKFSKKSPDQETTISIRVESKKPELESTVRKESLSIKEKPEVSTDLVPVEIVSVTQSDPEEQLKINQALTYIQGELNKTEKTFVELSEIYLRRTQKLAESHPKDKHLEEAVKVSKETLPSIKDFGSALSGILENDKTSPLEKNEKLFELYKSPLFDSYCTSLSKMTVLYEIEINLDHKDEYKKEIRALEITDSIRGLESDTKRPLIQHSTAHSMQRLPRHVMLMKEIGENSGPEKKDFSSVIEHIEEKATILNNGLQAPLTEIKKAHFEKGVGVINLIKNRVSDIDKEYKVLMKLKEKKKTPEEIKLYHAQELKYNNAYSSLKKLIYAIDDNKQDPIIEDLQSNKAFSAELQTARQIISPNKPNKNKGGVASLFKR